MEWKGGGLVLVLNGDAEDEDKHKAPSSAPLHSLSLRWGRGWFGKLLCSIILEGEGVDNEKDFEQGYSG